MMLKISHKAIAKFANVDDGNNNGTSAIFKLFQVRPVLLEKRMKRPPTAASAATATGSVNDSRNDDSNRRRIEGGGNNDNINSFLVGQKRRRL
jgi:hypothetical protein